MLRYFLVREEDMPAPDHRLGEFHYIDLESHGPAGKGWKLVALAVEHVKAPKGWIKAPHLLDAKTPLKAKLNHKLLADLGITGDETALGLMERLGEIHPRMSH